MLFASGEYGAIIWVVILTLGAWKMGKILKGNPVLGQAAKKGLLYALGRIFKK
jgi:hypothetical protein